MESQIKWIVILMLFVLLSPGYALAVINFSNGAWSTTFNYGPCTQRGGGGATDCDSVKTDGLTWSWGAASVSGHYTESASAANNPTGAGGKGFRVWVGDGDNITSGVVKVEFPSTQKELWVRWYERYQSGFAWNPLGYSKELYFTTNGAGISVIPEFYGSNGYALVAQGTSNYYQVNSNFGWSSVMGGNTSDGQFHCYEVYLKMDTNGSDGIGRLWIDGVLKANNINVNWSNGNSSARQGWINFEIKTNQNNPSNGQAMYVDFDDMSIYNSTPPNKDTQGNPFIGPIGGGGGGTSDTIAPIVTAFTIPPTSTSLAVPISTFAATDANGVSGYCVSTTNNSSNCSWASTIPSTVVFSSSGTQNVYAWAKDAAGNISSPATASVAITSPVNGVCGSANGQSFTSLTSGSSNLCSTGTVASFTGSGPWTWGCNGSGGGSNTSSTACSASLASSSPANLLFSESFENNSFASRGWYDNTNQGTIVSGGQSGNCLQWAWASGATTPTNGGSMRMEFTPTDSLYLSYYVKFQTGWRGSQKTYHPHMLYFLSDLDNTANAYSPLANNYLNTYVEFLSDVGSPYTIRPLLAIQDEKRVNTSNGTPPNNLTGVTENRSVAYCNTPVSSGATGQCYADNPYYSANTWKASNASVSTNAWHRVEVYFKMNTISGGKGQSNGIMVEWIDGVKVIDQSDVLYRTNQDSTKKWAQFVLAPYIGDGAPITETMWIDELTVATAPPNSSPVTAPTVTIKSISPN